jgi:hypothetical protein
MPAVAPLSERKAHSIAAIRDVLKRHAEAVRYLAGNHTTVSGRHAQIENRDHAVALMPRCLGDALAQFDSLLATMRAIEEATRAMPQEREALFQMVVDVRELVSAAIVEATK